MRKSAFYALIDRGTVAGMIRQNPTPCYLYFLKIVEKRFADLKACLPPGFKIHYALKANPNVQLIRTMKALGAGADAASMGEIKSALACGISSASIEFSGPGKTEQEILFAVNQGLGSINAESLVELRKIAVLCKAVARKARVGIRINTGHAVKAGLSMGGETQFGIHERDVREALDYIQQHDCLSFTGIHVHAGSQLLDAEAILANVAHILELALRIDGWGVLAVNKSNFGGGWGVNYFQNQQPLDMARLQSGLQQIFSDGRYHRLLQHADVILEPGRFLAAECGLYAVRVLYAKQGLEKNFIITDGGMHQNYLLAGGMGQVIRRNFEIDSIGSDEGASGSAKKYDIAGCLCTSQDLLALDYAGDREIREGDYILFFNSGAYGLTASPIHFLSHPPPQEIIVGAK
ncbi:MAG: alanine racemase [Proteobacteria bacterium]|nr:alanine racemase [Pseudomonadota bacterium]